MRAETKPAMELETKPSMKSGGIDTCEWDWPVSDNPCGCLIDTDDDANGLKAHTFIESEEQCMEAAKEAGVSAPGVHAHFAIGPPVKSYDHWQQEHPMGCFKVTDCSLDPRGICYFYNEIAIQPIHCNPDKSATLQDGTRPNVTGSPVCKRQRYAFGLKPNENHNCPDGYGTIMDDGACRIAGTCDGYRDDCDANFIADARDESVYRTFPEGCFSHAEAAVENDLCVQFNKPVDGFELPDKPVGTTICEVSNKTDFRNLPIINADATVSHTLTDESQIDTTM
jgi:hypothetical protein